MENSTQKRPQAVFISSSAHFRDLPVPNGEEFAILGRSNVGKSSFINHVLENRNLAKVSNKPGKTSLANFYRVDNEMVWVDLPGYGFAKVSGEERTRWTKLIADYCERRSNLSGLIWLIDSRHIGTKLDLAACEWLKKLEIPVFPVLTKTDKINTNEKKQAVKQSQKIFGLTYEPVLYSIEDNQSRERFWEKFNLWHNCIKKKI